jgi:hypothetical protein
MTFFEFFLNDANQGHVVHLKGALQNIAIQVYTFDCKIKLSNISYIGTSPQRGLNCNMGSVIVAAMGKIRETCSDDDMGIMP